MNNIILTGVLQQIPYGLIDSRSRIYPKDVFDKACREYEQKILKQKRMEKLNKINEKYYNK
jgi:hypothetical protein